MSNGYLLAADADLPGLADVADGFGLDTVGANEATAAALQGAANVGIVLSHAATRDASFVALLQVLAHSLRTAQLILVEPDAHGALGFLPAAWPSMALTDARVRAGDLLRRRAEAESGAELPRAHPLPPIDSPAKSDRPVVRMATIMVARHSHTARLAQSESGLASQHEAWRRILTESGGRVFREGDHLLFAEFAEPNAAIDAAMQLQASTPAAALRFGFHYGEVVEETSGELSGETVDVATRLADAGDVGGLLLTESVRERLDSETAARFAQVSREDVKGADAPMTVYGAQAERDAALNGGAPPAQPLGEAEEQAPQAETAPAPAPPSQAAPPAPQAAEPPRQREGGGLGSSVGGSAPADATAFAPKKLRRGSPELVRIVIHQPKDLQAIIQAAREIDPRTDAAPSGMKVGNVAIGASVGVALEVRGAACDGAIQRRTWAGEPLDFNFSTEADAEVKQAVFLVRVFVDDAQIGVLAFTRPVGGPKKNAAPNDRVRLKRHKRVFLSYSSNDRETVSAIATAYEAAGVQHFFDRTSLKSGEEWSPRLRGEIDRADLFHLCWSKSAAASDWVVKEAEHALTRRRRSNGKKPDITVQMLDGPPWAKHPDSLDSINFDDFVRAAIVGYARGDGEA